MTLPFKSFARKSCVSPVPRVAVAGVRVMRIPESKVKLNLPVFFLSALEVAVMVTITLGSLVWSGKTFGAVNVAVEATVVLVFWMLERAPTAGSPLAVLAGSQAKAAEGAGLGTAGRRLAGRA